MIHNHTFMTPPNFCNTEIKTTPKNKTQNKNNNNRKERIVKPWKASHRNGKKERATNSKLVGIDPNQIPRPRTPATHLQSNEEEKGRESGEDEDAAAAAAAPSSAAAKEDVDDDVDDDDDEDGSATVALCETCASQQKQK